MVHQHLAVYDVRVCFIGIFGHTFGGLNVERLSWAIFLWQNVSLHEQDAVAVLQLSI